MRAGQIRKVTATTGIISTAAGYASISGDPGPPYTVSFYSFGLAVDLAGNIYISDEGNEAIRKVDAVSGIVTTIAGGPRAPQLW